MIVQVQKSFLNYFTVFAKNVTRKYGVPAVSSVKKKVKTQYPKILDLSRRASIRRKRETWHKRIQKLETVEEKLYGINMPRYYGWRSLCLQEGQIPYNALSHAQYITRTHVVNDYGLPNFYNNLASEQLDILLQTVKKPIEDMIAFEYCDRQREKELSKDVDDKKEFYSDITNAVTYQINRIVLSGLSSTLPHLMEAEIDFDPRIEAFWFVGGVEPPISIQKKKESIQHLKEYANDPINVPVQYCGSPILQLRHQFPLEEIVPLSESKNPELSIPQFKYDPRVLEYKFFNRHVTNIPGFWPGDPAEFGLLSYHNASHLLHRPKHYNDDMNALTVQAIFASYGWLLSQACYQGFSPVNNITYPLVSQTILTNGQWWTFCVYQLNTTLLHSEYADENPVSNMCWITEPMKLFDAVEDGRIHGFNEDVLKSLIKFYINTPKERIGVNMQPYLGESVKHIADIPDDERRVWLEKHFKHVMSNRPRHLYVIQCIFAIDYATNIAYEINNEIRKIVVIENHNFRFLYCRKMPEISTWQKIYMIRHKTRLFDKKRDPWEFGFRPSNRRMDDHLPIYVPKCLRENPKQKRKGRFAKTYYPAA